MLFAHDTEVALVGVANLVNTLRAGEDLLVDPAALAAFFDQESYTGHRSGTLEELEQIRGLRARLATIWHDTDTDIDTERIVGVVNDLLASAQALPRLSRHDGWDWHLHLTDPDAPLVDRMGTEAAMAVADLIRAQDLERLKRCAAQDCDAVLVDLSRNRSRRYCDTGNCGNRMHVAAYRARRAD